MRRPDEVKERGVLVSGALGNLGWKLLRHLAGQGYERLVGLDVRPEDGHSAALRRIAAGAGSELDVEFGVADLADWHDRRWRDLVQRVGAVVHFAAQNPYPEADWDDATASFDMTLHLAHSAVDNGVGRFVFASSNHVMGRYKDSPLAERIAPGQLTTELEPGVGTLWNSGQRDMDSTVYACSKLAGERLCEALGHRAEGRTTFVCTRIGWCQPGANQAHTLSAAGTPTQEGEAGPGVDSVSYQRNDRWFKGMWLSNGDFLRLYQRALEADGAAWPKHCVVVNGMSDNTGMAWSLAEGRQWLGYAPQDDVQRALTPGPGSPAEGT